MIYPWFDLTQEKIDDYATKLEEITNDSNLLDASVILTKKDFIDTPFYNEVTKYITFSKSFYLVVIKYPPCFPDNKFLSLISYIYLYLWGVNVHIDPPWMYRDFDWNTVVYNNELIASAFKRIQANNVERLVMILPTNIPVGNPYINSLSFDKIKTRITGALYDAKIYKQYNSPDDISVQSPVCVLL